jgi:hypothetical protein
LLPEGQPQPFQVEAGLPGCGLFSKSGRDYASAILHGNDQSAILAAVYRNNDRNFLEVVISPLVLE